MFNSNDISLSVIDRGMVCNHLLWNISCTYFKIKNVSSGIFIASTVFISKEKYQSSRLHQNLIEIDHLDLNAKFSNWM